MLSTSAVSGYWFTISPIKVFLFTTVVPISFSSLFLIFCSDYTIIETTRMLLQQRKDDFHEYFFSFQHAAVSWNQRERNLGAA